MNVRFDYDMVKNCIAATNKEIEELERNREKMLSMGFLYRDLEKLIDKKKRELEGLEYALNNMT